MTNYQDQIEQQFEFNQGKNLFYQGIIHALRFSPDTLNAIEEMDNIDPDSENLLIDYLTNRAIQEFCKINQYFTFDRAARLSLRNLYVDLFANIKYHKTPIDEIAEKHYEKLIQWLQDSNSFAEKIYSTEGEKIEPVACSEYSPALQLEVLHLDLAQMAEPILDIGCGKKGSLVLYLRQKGLDAYGIDRLICDDSIFTHADWFEYPFEKEQWGTIISNLGFSNHFLHHHLRNDGNFITYAKKYMEILSALKIDGSFHYAPDLPFIEQYLDRDKYQLTKYRLGNYEFNSSSIKRLK